MLREARLRADELGCTASVMTFDRHPSVVITGRTTPLITSRRDREYLMKSLYGIDEVLFIHFSHAMMEMPWEEFVDDCLLRDLNVVHVICGADFRFGYRGEGTAELLREACAAYTSAATSSRRSAWMACRSTLPWSATCCAGGEMDEAARFLGHPHCLSGSVISGKRLGRTMGIPTANITVPPEVLVLPAGVYATRVAFGGRDYAAVTNVGTYPTVSDHAPLVVEPWILDFSGDLYGKEIRVFFYKKLRDEIKFPDLSALQAEIRRNADETRAYFAK